MIYYLSDQNFTFMDTKSDLLITILFYVLGAVVGRMIGSKYIKKEESLKEENHTLYVVMALLEVPFALLLNVPWILTFKLTGTF